MMPRLIALGVERDHRDRWEFYVGFGWGCGCRYTARARTPWTAARRALGAHTATRGA